MTEAPAGGAICEFAAAKINLALHVTGQRGDGYHLLDSLVTFADLGDRLTFSPSESDRFTLSGRFAGDLPHHDDPRTGNLVLKARNRLRETTVEAGEAAGPVHIHLEKNLPPAAGIGGGSADAAAVLRGLDRLWQPGLDAETLARIALSLGADVPMCLSSRPLVARGIGDIIVPATGFPGLDMVLANPLRPIATPAVFAALENRHNPPLSIEGQTPADASEWIALVRESRNDLQLAASRIAPVIHGVLDALSSAGASLARMSGSGATCFGLFDDAESARAAADRLAHARPDWFVAATATLAEGDDDHV
ncbi:4-(cytidine 5'-diphospho)-2-C-methyl-D-erythritol kinase [Martelella lutilitoris]|uniref:4-diphosphocytidyl-2-C-methyl-D-erythritol kinase n=1 Tax=Martelella lutilitoris TaxID=2583532 RepID=A0A5C4JVF3_9HYPH|nr:4-(cytidine 5'-diphospho)-2-C-methyl-D-erythritol kinase [Martelella lutilitoris]TNB49438.1 4-(cytidine 5'-diphospho)-2-C-methyl-D-erythritol kinase [Martelella lutilitoris]